MLINGVELRPLTRYPGYFAGSDGHIYSSRKPGPTTKQYATPHVLQGQPGSRGYLHVAVSTEPGRFVTKDIHPLICEAFHGPSPDGHECAHIDGSRTNNRPENLKWKTLSENQRDRLIHGTDDRGTHNTRACLDSAQLAEVRVLLSEGHSATSIAEKFGVSRRTISRVKHGDRYLDESREAA